MILDIGSSGLFNHSAQFFNVLADILKLAGGSFLILLFAVLSLVGIIVRSVFKGIEQSSLIVGVRSLISSVSYAIGISLALLFLLVVSIFFTISFAKVALITVAIVFMTAFIARESFMFFVLKRFGKYILYLTTLHRISKVVYDSNKENP